MTSEEELTEDIRLILKGSVLTLLVTLGLDVEKLATTIARLSKKYVKRKIKDLEYTDE